MSSFGGDCTYLAIMAGAGPIGLGALTYALHRDVRPSMVVVTDVN